MPIYEYACAQCGTEFEELVFADEAVECPKCRSKNAEKKLSTFATTHADSAARARGEMPGPCGSCGDPRGPGACGLN
jgi:putative FmdB family regulatory protein